jgi:DNA excision repair protein ERCC-6
MQADVAQHLPKKTEQVLFVNLAPAQREAYKEFLRSEAVQETIDGRGSLFKAIHLLRKICNHPDLLLLKGRSTPQVEDW